MKTQKKKTKTNNKTKRNKSSIKTLHCITRNKNDKFQIGTSGFMVSQKIWFNLGCLNCIEIKNHDY